MNAKILLVEDHRPLAETVGLFLENTGFTLDYAADGLTALHLGTVNAYDAIILDVMLPGLDGFQICKRLREDAGISTPILMLTARDQLQDKLKGFEGGADDYLIKPFDLPELAARINALIRRERGELREKALQVEDLMMDTRTLTVTRQSKPIHLTPIGFRILKLLMRESPNVVKREDLERDIWGDDPPDSDTLRSHLYQLRKAVDKPFDQPLMHTIQGQGFKIGLMPSEP
ncbi:MAG: response regulator transcription factor [Hahellaceae bacterium]|nr:response regulator transcription factor [Hahellaceae bacterium]